MTFEKPNPLKGCTYICMNKLKIFYLFLTLSCKNPSTYFWFWSRSITKFQDQFIYFETNSYKSIPLETEGKFGNIMKSIILFQSNSRSHMTDHAGPRRDGTSVTRALNFKGHAYIQLATVQLGLYTVAEVAWLSNISNFYLQLYERDYIQLWSFSNCMTGIIYLVHVYFRMHIRVMGQMYFKVFNERQCLLSFKTYFFSLTLFHQFFIIMNNHSVISQSFNQLIRKFQSISQSVNQSISQSVNQSIHQ